MQSRHMRKKSECKLCKWTNKNKLNDSKIYIFTHSNDKCILSESTKILSLVEYFGPAGGFSQLLTCYWAIGNC